MNDIVSLGIALAIGIVHVRTLDRSLMLWIIASQTVPVQEPGVRRVRSAATSPAVKGV